MARPQIRHAHRGQAKILPNRGVRERSVTGNTEKVARAIAEGLESEGCRVTERKIAEGVPEDLYDFDLVCLGSPSYTFLPHRTVLDFVAERMRLHNQRGDVVVRAPKRPGKRAVVFITYSGQHTGIDEATTAGKYLMGIARAARPFVRDLYEGFRERFGAVDCRTLVGYDFNDPVENDRAHGDPERARKCREYKEWVLRRLLAG